MACPTVATARHSVQADLSAPIDLGLENSDRRPRAPDAGAINVALVGNPNAGKSTVFNALTGLRQQVGNFPGVTVERVEGFFTHDGARVVVTDLPGTYSLAAESPDERIA